MENSPNSAWRPDSAVKPQSQGICRCCHALSAKAGATFTWFCLRVMSREEISSPAKRWPAMLQGRFPDLLNNNKVVDLKNLLSCPNQLVCSRAQTPIASRYYHEFKKCFFAIVNYSVRQIERSIFVRFQTTFVRNWFRTFVAALDLCLALNPFVCLFVSSFLFSLIKCLIFVFEMCLDPSAVFEASLSNARLRLNPPLSLSKPVTMMDMLTAGHPLMALATLMYAPQGLDQVRAVWVWWLSFFFFECFLSLSLFLSFSHSLPSFSLHSSSYCFRRRLSSLLSSSISPPDASTFFCC